jgi:hypothetical protein
MLLKPDLTARGSGRYQIKPICGRITATFELSDIRVRILFVVFRFGIDLSKEGFPKGLIELLPGKVT